MRAQRHPELAIQLGSMLPALPTAPTSWQRRREGRGEEEKRPWTGRWGDRILVPHIISGY
jgi:hypothetical protein